MTEIENATWADLSGPEIRRFGAAAWIFVHYLAVGGTEEARSDLFKMLKVASSGRLPAVIKFPITRFEDSFRDYALKAFPSKRTANVFVQELGRLPMPTPMRPLAPRSGLAEVRAIHTAPLDRIISATTASDWLDPCIYIPARESIG